MTTIAEPLTTRRTPVLLRVAAALAVVLAIVDLIGAIAYWSYAPIEINIAYLVISALTIVGAVFAWRGAAWGVWVVVVTRVLSLALSVPVFLAPGVPPEAVAPTVIQDVVTVAAIILLLVGLSRSRKA